MTDHPSNPPSQERITAAAIQVEGVIYTGPHHATIVHYVAKCAGIKPVKGPQGFVTSLGRFVDRADALPIAIAAGQVGADCKTVGGLFSEMLWIVPEDSALATQEARHKAEMEKYREELVQISVWLPNHGGMGATVLTQVQTAVLEAESKLRISHVQNAVLQREVGLLEETISEQASKLREATERIEELRDEMRLREGSSDFHT